MLPTKLAFIDVETTGARASYDRIIEIGILRVEDNTLTKTFQSLINPQSYLPKEITMLTGITQQDIENAPTFRSLKNEIFDTLKDCTFIAHNVRFDYAFLKHEFLRENITYSSKHFCTVRLSRILFPQWKHHNLDALIQECNIECTRRHRAFDDARVLFEFYQQLLTTLPKKKLEEALGKTMKKPSLPLHLPIEELDKLPEKPGVYIFYGAATLPENSKDSEKSDIQKLRSSDNPKHRSSESFELFEKHKNKFIEQIPLYIGKSVNIRNRVLSHFSSDISSSTEMHIAQQIKRIETITTAGELGALLLESQLIKEMLPIYNKKSRIKHELIAVKKRKTNNDYDECYLEPITKINAYELQDFLGFFRSRKQAKATLADLAKTHKLCEKLLGLENTNSECFAHRLNRCSGACVGKEKPAIYNLKLQIAFSENKILPWPFNGAILIQESDGVYDESGLQEKSEYFIIDNWCYLGTVTTDSFGSFDDKSLAEVAFDLDIYKILRQFLRNPANQKKIKVIARKERTQATKQQVPHRQ
jgi:DNA polymerase-3 subunit epsilon